MTRIGDGVRTSVFGPDLFNDSAASTPRFGPATRTAPSGAEVSPEASPSRSAGTTSARVKPRHAVSGGRLRPHRRRAVKGLDFNRTHPELLPRNFSGSYTSRRSRTTTHKRLGYTGFPGTAPRALHEPGLREITVSRRTVPSNRISLNLGGTTSRASPSRRREIPTRSSSRRNDTPAGPRRNNVALRFDGLHAAALTVIRSGLACSTAALPIAIGTAHQQRHQRPDADVHRGSHPRTHDSSRHPDRRALPKPTFFDRAVRRSSIRRAWASSRPSRRTP